METTTRRSFIQNTGLAAGSLSLMGLPVNAWTSGQNGDSLSVHIFSKHLQFLDYKAAGQAAAELGFSGLDLTVRPKGHVLPESVKTDLPKAVKEIEEGGSGCQMITTNIESILNPLDMDVLQTAAMLGIEYYRSGWYKFPKDQSMTEALEIYSNQVRELSQVNRDLGIVGCYQNHAGTNVGASFWEVKMILEKADPQYFGSQFDIRHATVEGGLSWENSLRLLHPHIKTIVLKDFKWGKVDGKWKVINTPIGEGMVDFHKYFRLLKSYGLKPPVSLHVEYPVGGAEHGARELTVDKEIVFRAMKTDLDAIRKIWKEA